MKRRTTDQSEAKFESDRIGGEGAGFEENTGKGFEWLFEQICLDIRCEI